MVHLFINRVHLFNIDPSRFSISVSDRERNLSSKKDRERKIQEEKISCTKWHQKIEVGRRKDRDFEIRVNKENGQIRTKNRKGEEKI